MMIATRAAPLRRFARRAVGWVLRRPSVRTLGTAAADRVFAQLARRVDANSQPQLNSIALSTRESHAARMGYKQLISWAAEQQASRLPAAPTVPSAMELECRPATQRDLEAPWCRYWAAALGAPPGYHRKAWELAFVAQTAWQTGKLTPGTQAVGFGCGTEPLPSLFAAHGVRVLATDLQPERVARGWVETGQHASDVKRLHRAELVGEKEFERLVTLRYVDMTEIPTDLNGTADFVWSVCAFEHLGTRALGLDFVVRSAALLRPGGVAVHTTEFNFSSSETVDNWPTVLFVREDFELLADRLKRLGYWVAPLDFEAMRGPLDGMIDIPPYAWDENALRFGAKDKSDFELQNPHIKLSVDGFPATCFAVVFGRE